MGWLENYAERVMLRPPDLVVPGIDNKPYMRRWNIKTFLGCQLTLHHFCGYDADPPHDHPGHSISLQVFGGASEYIHDEQGMVKDIVTIDNFKRVRIRHARTLHTIYPYSRKRDRLVTFFLMGPTCRRWGFQTKDGWVDHEKYLADREKLNADEA